MVGLSLLLLENGGQCYNKDLNFKLNIADVHNTYIQIYVPILKGI